MRDTAHSLRRRWRRALAATMALPLALGLLATPAQAQNDPVADAIQSSSSLWSPPPEGDGPAAPPRETEQDLPNLPGEVDVEKVQWLSERHVKVFINSPSMPGEPIAVQLLLPRDWSQTPDRTFPAVWHLDGMRARDDWSGWTLETNIERYYADKNVLVVMPVGGESSFYTDWNEPDNGKNYQWESFLLDELPHVLEQGWRANDRRAIVGLSMGGTAAMNLAAHRPEMFDFVGSFSGYLDTSSLGMPQAIHGAMQEAGGYNAWRMWGPSDSPRWRENDPKLNVGNLAGISMYISAGSGNTGEWDQPSTSNPRFPDNPAAFGLEALSRMTSETFIQYARREGVDVTARFRDSGTHSWPYWQFEMSQSFPQMADALGLEANDRGVTCNVGGAIGERYRDFEGLGMCLSGEYRVAGGVAQDFSGGRGYWSEATGAHFAWGRIGGRYHEIGGPESPLGFPTTSETITPDGVGRFNHFEHGSIYWTPDTGAQVVMADIANAWADEGWETGRLGYPTSERYDVPGGVAQDFEGGYIVKPNEGDARVVLGAIGAAYRAGGGPAETSLGLPLTDEIPLPKDNGFFQRFEHGNIYWSHGSGAHAVPDGDIMTHWGTTGWENGPFGYPVGPQRQIPAGGLEQEFQGGWIRQINGEIEEERR